MAVATFVSARACMGVFVCVCMRARAFGMSTLVCTLRRKQVVEVKGR